VAAKLPEKVRKEGATVRTIIEILRAMLQEEPYRCPYCQSDQLVKGEILPDRNYSSIWIGLGNRAPPLQPVSA
jgi:DNA-directed RNA polymerase subunit RPC12/RpoP